VLVVLFCGVPGAVGEEKWYFWLEHGRKSGALYVFFFLAGTTKFPLILVRLSVYGLKGLQTQCVGVGFSVMSSPLFSCWNGLLLFLGGGESLAS
jgi:hypothetical protein